MTESPILFGPERNLLGILTSPTQASGSRPVACLLLNVGVTHRIGPRRLNVKLARRLADLGIHSMRLDLSGIGDSTAANSRASFREQSIRDLQLAMDAIEAATGIRRFVVLGICSGAINGYWLAQADTRVVGLLMFDGFSFPTFKTQLVHDWHRARTASMKVVGLKAWGRVKRLLGLTSEATPPSIFNAVSDPSLPNRAEFAHVLGSLVARGVALYLVYSGSLLLYHNYRGQLADVVADAALMRSLRYDYLPDIDHIATPQAAQVKLLRMVCDWVDEVGDAAPAPLPLSFADSRQPVEVQPRRAHGSAR